MQQFASVFEAIGDAAELNGGIRHGKSVDELSPAGRRRYIWYAFGGRPVMRIPESPLWRMFRPTNSAVMCFRMRAFFHLAPSMARTPGIFAANERTIWSWLASALEQITARS